MYRRVLTALPQEPQFPQDLKGLGYFINDKDQLESIDKAGEDFKYKVSKNARYNELRKETLNGCLRKIVLERLTGIGLSTIRLPLGVKENEPHVPILASPNLTEKSRVIVIFNGREQDLGIWAYRRLGSGGSSIDAGSAVYFVKHLATYYASEEDVPGVIIANIGQLLWHRKGKRAVTFTTWQDMPRKSAVSDVYRIDEKKNTIPGNENGQAHISYIFNKVIKELVGDKAVLDILSVSPAFELMDFLDENWEEWNGRIEAMALTQPIHRVQQFENEDLKKFLLKRARAYIVSDEPEGELQYEPSYGCAVYSSGEKDWPECIIPTAYKLILDFFQDVATDPNFTNPETIIIEDNKAQEQGFEGPVGGETVSADEIKFWDDLTEEEKREWHAGERL